MKPCRFCDADPLGICEGHERMAEERKEAREHGGYDSTSWQQGQDAYERYLDRIGEGQS